MNKYLIQNKTNSILRTIDGTGNLIESPSQTLDEDNYLTNGFNDVTKIPVDQLKALGNLSDFKLLMWTDDTTKTEATMTYELLNPYRPIDILKNVDSGKFDVLMKEI